MSRITLQYWKPTVYEVSGHTTMTIDYGDGTQELVGVWAIFPDKTTGVACAAHFSPSLEIDSQVIGFRCLVHTHFAAQKIDSPFGIGIYLVVLDELKKFTTVDALKARLLNWKNEFVLLALKTLSDHEKQQIDIFCDFISNYLSNKAMEDLLRAIDDAGAPTDTVVVNQLDTNKMRETLRELRITAESGNLLWAAQVGSQTDRDLFDQHANRLNRFALFPFTSAAPGVKGYEKGKMRHNCSSLILMLMQIGGIDRYLTGYHEQPAARLREITALADPNDKSRAKSIKIRLIGLIPEFSMARYCGTTPHELYDMSKYAEAQRLNPREEQRRCAMM